MRSKKGNSRNKILWQAVKKKTVIKNRKAVEKIFVYVIFDQSFKLDEANNLCEYTYTFTNASL